MVLRKGKISIGPTDLTNRKNPTLVVMVETNEGLTVIPYASFRSREAADSFMEILADFVGAKERTDNNG